MPPWRVERSFGSIGFRASLKICQEFVRGHLMWGRRGARVCVRPIPAQPTCRGRLHMNRKVLPVLAAGLLSLSMVAVAAPAAMAVPSYCSASQYANGTDAYC